MSSSPTQRGVNPDEEAILEDLRGQPWMGLDPGAEVADPQAIWHEVTISQFKLGEGSADMICAVFPTKDPSQGLWYPVDTDSIVPVNDSNFRWVPVGKCTWHRVRNVSDRERQNIRTAVRGGKKGGHGSGVPGQEYGTQDDDHSDADCTTHDVKSTPVSGTRGAQMDEMLSPGGTIDNDVESLLLDHYYRLEVTEIESGVATLSWHFPPGNPRDCSTWLGFYPIAGQKPMPGELPSNDLFDGRCAFKYVTKNSAAGVVRFNLTQNLKSKEDGTYFFAMQAHSMGTIFSVSKTVQVRGGELASFEGGVSLMAPHDGMEFLRKPRADTDKVKEAKTIHAKPIRPDAQYQEEPERPFQRKPKPKPKARMEEERGPQGVTESPQESRRAHSRAVSEAPSGSENEEGGPVSDDSCFSLRVEKADDSLVHISWRFPPGNPSDSSSYISLYNSVEWVPVKSLPFDQPGPGGLGYKYITTNGVTGTMKFMMVNNPKRDFKNGAQYVFALHYEDKVYALSQSITLQDLKVVQIGENAQMRRAVFKATSRGRGVRRPTGNRHSSPSSLSAHAYDEDEEEDEATTRSRLPPVRKASKNRDADFEANGAVHNALRQMGHPPEHAKPPNGVAKKRLHDMVFSDDDDEEDEGWTFRCLCGTKGQNYNDGTAMVACEKCDTWQHAACVGMENRPESEQYLCWQCEKAVPLKKKRLRYDAYEEVVPARASTTPSKAPNDVDAVQLLHMLASSGSPAVPGKVKAESSAHEEGAASYTYQSEGPLAGSIRLQFDLGFGHSFNLSVPRGMRLMDMGPFVEEALHQSGPGQMLLVTSLTDCNGASLPTTVEDGGHLAAGHKFREMDVVSVVCRQRQMAAVATQPTVKPPASMPYVNNDY